MHDHGGRRTPARPPRRWRRLHLAGLVGALALTLAVAACGGGGGKSNRVASLNGPNKPTATTTAASGSSDPRQATLNFARCVRQHGISNLPDPKMTASGIDQPLPRRMRPDDPRLTAAEQACAQHGGVASEDAAAAHAGAAHGRTGSGPTGGLVQTGRNTAAIGASQ